MNDYISLLDRKVNESKGVSIQIDSPKVSNISQKPQVCGWSETGKGCYVHFSEFYSPLEEQEEIVSEIKRILATPVSQNPPDNDRIKNLYRENRVENRPMNHVVGVFFKTQKEVVQFCNQLKQSGIPYRGNEEVCNVCSFFIIMISFPRDLIFSIFYTIRTILAAMI